MNTRLKLKKNSTPKSIMMKFNRLKKYILWIVPAALLILFTGCEDSILNKKPQGELTSGNFFETEDHAIQATNATYSMGRQWQVHVFSWVGMTDIASDDAEKGSLPNDAEFLGDIDMFDFGPENIAFQDTWSGYYQGIYRANLAIENIPNIDMDEELRSRLVAENKFLRAYYYFFLVRAFGGVPLVTEALEPDEYDQERADASDVYNLIVQDLMEAADNLPLKSEYAADDLGRATRGAANALLAKVHLFQENYDDAETVAREVIDSGEYSLYDDYETLFLDEGENSSESIFEIQSTSLETGEGGTQYNQIQGVRGEPNLGWGFNQPNNDLQEAYENGDPRQGATILYVWEILPDDSDVVRDNPQMSDERYNQKAFVSPNPPGGQGQGPGNIRRIRYADVLLIAAEAAYQNGNESDARDWVNQVRERARHGRDATIGITAEDLPSVLADTLDISGTEHPMIRGVDEDGPADNANLRPLQWELIDDNSNILVENIDLIESVDGTEVNSLDEYLAEMESKTAGTPVILEIQRITQTEDNGSRNTDIETLTVTVNTEQLLPDVTASGEDLLEAIWHERRVELAMEQHRFFDIVRQGRAGELLREQGKNFEDGTHELYPIPQSEIDISEGLLDQNSGY